MPPSINNSSLREQVRNLTWRRDGRDWLLFADRKRVGRVVPDPNYLGMWRPVRADGQLGDMVNLTWAKSATLDAACRELLGSERDAIDRQKCPENRGVFEGSSSLVCQNPAGVLR